MSGDDPTLALRQAMVREQIADRGITGPAVLAAFEAVPRHLFVPPALAHRAYDDSPLPIGLGQTISQPYVVALTVQELAPQPHHRVLDVGSGSGYQSAILAHLVRQVYAIERLAELADRARTVLAELNVTNVATTVGDGSLGLPDEAPFDGIVCGAGAPSVPPAWLDQLADGGRLVVPVGIGDVQMLTVVSRRGADFETREVCPVRFVKLIGRQGWGS
jgi:protein-L-isoaspartate(D-aspartate) O-methyltransferase